MSTYPKPSDPVSAYTRADGTTESNSTDHGRVIGIWENAKHHGATGNGTTDDTAAIQAAIDALPSTGGMVYVPQGYYKITSTILLKKRMVFAGAGQNTVLLHYAGANPMVKANGVGAPASVRIRDMVLGAPLTDLISVTGTGDCLYLYGSSADSDFQVHNVTFNDLPGTASWALKVENCLETIVSNCNFRTCLGGGIYFKGNSNASVVRDCVMSNNAQGSLGGILVEYPSSGVKLHNNVIESWRGSYGVSIAGSTDCLLEGNWFEDNWGDSVLITAAAATSVIHNYFQVGSGASHAALTYVGLNQASSIIGNDFRDAVTLCTDPSATFSNNYVLMGNEWSTGGSLTNNANATRDTVVEIASRDTWGGTRGLVIHQGPIAHKGTTLGFYGQTPAARASAYTVTNPTTDRALNVTGDTLPQVAEVLGTLIADLQSYGLLQ